MKTWIGEQKLIDLGYNHHPRLLSYLLLQLDLNPSRKLTHFQLAPSLELLLKVSSKFANQSHEK